MLFTLDYYCCLYKPSIKKMSALNLLKKIIIFLLCRLQLTKGREQLEEARRTYEILNTELHDELPALYDSRILFLVTNLQTLFATEQVFHNETAKVWVK